MNIIIYILVYTLQGNARKPCRVLHSSTLGACLWLFEAQWITSHILQDNFCGTTFSFPYFHYVTPPPPMTTTDASVKYPLNSCDNVLLRELILLHITVN